MTDAEKEELVRKHFECISRKQLVHEKDAQFWDGAWWIPKWGCDTLEKLLEDL